MGAFVPCILLALAFTGYHCSDTFFPEIQTKECRSTYNKATGSFKLTLHNLSTPCIWHINATEQNSTGISLLFETLFLHENDEVTLYNDDPGFQFSNKSLIPPLRAQNGSVTIVTNETSLYIKLDGNVTNFDRTFVGFFQSQACAFTIPPAVHIMHSPVGLNVDTVHCEFNFVKDSHRIYTLPSIVMEAFNYSTSTLEILGSTFSGTYTHDPPEDFFPSWISAANEMTLKTVHKSNSSEYYRFRIEYVDSRCSGKVTVGSTQLVLVSPKFELNNGSFITECRWVIQHSNVKQILGLVFESLYFNSVIDILAINNGLSELSSPLLQVTASNKDQIMKQVIRSTNASMWISFNPVNYSSFFSGNITVHGQGGYFKNSGSFSMHDTTGNDSIFLLEVENSKLVLLNFTSANVVAPGKVDIYDGFNMNNLLASLRGNIWYPVLGKSSRLMAVATGFNTGSSFSAEFNSVSPGCYQMSTLTSEDFILQEHCNTTCQWVIPSQNLPNSVLALDLQYLSLKNGTVVEIIQLDAAKTLLGSITSNVTHVPQLVIEADVGALVKVVQGNCTKQSDDVVLVGHSSYVPICGGKISPKPSEKFFVTSPRYPDTYPVFAKCQWNISVAKDYFVHYSFDAMQLAQNHCIKVSNGGKTNQFSGNKPPSDLLLGGETVIEFDSKDCGKSLKERMLISDAGFKLNNTVADCGGALQGVKTGEFNTSIAINKTLCIWMISVPNTGESDDSVNSISFTIAQKDTLENYNLQIYDGASVREREITNLTGPVIWGRTDTLIVVYKRLNPSKPSSIFVFNYKTINCNASMQCANKICMHPDWRCNNVDDCGDFSDEKNCVPVPIPPKTEYLGYSTGAFWSSVIILFIVGVALGIAAIVIYQKKKDGEYRRFGTSEIG